MSNPLDSEAELIAQIRAGDSNAWTQLVDRFEGRLLAYFDSRLSNRSASEDRPLLLVRQPYRSTTHTDNLLDG